MLKVAVIGLGRFGSRLARLLMESGEEVIGIDRDAALVEALRDEVTLAVRLDATDPAALSAQSIDQVDIAIVGIGQEFESSALTVATLRELGVKKIIARAETEIQGKILSRIGASETVSPERESAQRWAQRITMPNFERHVEIGKSLSLVYVAAPTSLLDRTLADLDLRNAYGVNVVAIFRAQGGLTAPDTAGLPDPIAEVPSARTVIRAGDTLVMLGKDEDIERFPTE